MIYIQSLLSVWNTVWPILVAILAFGLLIFIHEFGHFIFAKLFGIRVNEFSIWFGPKIIKFKKGETQYSFGILPFGGYCSMEGEDSESDDENAFCNKKVWQRIIVVVAGAVFNLILGFIMMTLVVSLSSAVATTTVHSFVEEATSNADGGLMEGDTILKIDGRKIYTSDDVTYMLGTVENGIVSMEVERNGETVSLPNVKFPTVTEEGQTFTSRDFYFTAVDKNIFTVIKAGFEKSVSIGRMVWMSLGDLISGKYGLSDVSGPVGVTQVVSNAATSVATDGVAGLQYLLRILSLITINLGIFNLLPIPALDGGRLIFLVIEGIRRKPIPPEKEGIVHGIGMALLLIFMVVVMFKDLWVWIF